MAQHLPDAKVIIILRNPIDRAISAYYHYMKYGVIPIRPPSYILKIIKNSFNKDIKAYENILRYGYYYTLYQNLLKYYNAENILLIKQEDLLKGDGIAVFEKACLFLNISLRKIEAPQIIPQASIYDYKRLFIRRLKTSFKYKFDADRTKSYAISHSEMTLLGRFVFSSGSRLESFYSQKFATKDRIDNDIRNALRDYYKNEIIMLDKLNVIDCKDWLD